MFQHRKTSPLTVSYICIYASTCEQFAPICLTDISMYAIGHYHNIQNWLNWICHPCLKRMRFNRQTKSSHICKHCTMPSHCHTNLFCFNVTFSGIDSYSTTIFLSYSYHFTSLNDINTKSIGGTPKTPSNSVMPSGAPPLL